MCAEMIKQENNQLRLIAAIITLASGILALAGFACMPIWLACLLAVIEAGFAVLAIAYVSAIINLDPTDLAEYVGRSFERWPG